MRVGRRTAEVLVAPLDVDAVTVALGRERSDSRTQTLTVAAGVTATRTRTCTRRFTTRTKPLAVRRPHRSV